MLAAAGLVRHGSVVADIGTDHAYLPIYLVESGISPRAIACDLREGPLSRAAINVQAMGLSDRIALKLTDGLHGLDEFAPDDILICGMGGELIIQILSAAAFIRNPEIRLILQPMKSADSLRVWLCENQFEIVAESLAAEDERIYEIICARYCGSVSRLSQAEALAGFAPHDALYSKALRQKIARLQKQIDGWLVSGRDATELLALRSELEAMLEPNDRPSEKGEVT